MMQVPLNLITGKEAEILRTEAKILMYLSDFHIYEWTWSWITSTALINSDFNTSHAVEVQQIFVRSIPYPGNSESSSQYIEQ